MKKIIFVLLLFAFVACKTKTATNSKVEEPKPAAISALPSNAILAEGKMHYEKYCGSCHELHLPSSFAEGKWNKEVPKMVIKSNEKTGSEEITAKMQSDILAYVVNGSKSKF